MLSNDPKIPEKEILDAVKDVLKQKKTVRVIRKVTAQWTLKDIETYEKILKLGSQVRYLDKINMRYSIFDRKAIVFWLPERDYPKTALVAVWVTSSPLAEILYEHFERLWSQSQLVIPVLETLKKAKLEKEH